MKTINVNNLNSIDIAINETYKLVGNRESLILNVLKDINSNIIFDNCHINELEININQNCKVRLDNYTFNDNDTYFKITIEEDSKLDFKQISTSKLSSKLNVELNGVSSTFNGSILTICSNCDAVMKTQVNHNRPLTNSKIENYGISLGNSQIEFNTTGKINKGNYKSNCYQLSRGIISGNNASVKSLPILLIDEYDVKANHGAAIGKMSDDELFYLMSRGMSKQEAFKLILSGIINPFLSNLIDENDAKKIENEIYKLV